MTTYLRACCTENLSLAPDLQDDHVLHYKDVCRHGIKVGGINPVIWKTNAAAGGLLSKLALRQARRGDRTSEKWREWRQQYQHPESQMWLSHTVSATKPAIPR